MEAFRIEKARGVGKNLYTLKKKDTLSLILGGCAEKKEGRERRRTRRHFVVERETHKTFHGFGVVLDRLFRRRQTRRPAGAREAIHVTVVRSFFPVGLAARLERSLCPALGRPRTYLRPP